MKKYLYFMIILTGVLIAAIFLNFDTIKLIQSIKIDKNIKEIEIYTNNDDSIYCKLFLKQPVDDKGYETIANICINKIVEIKKINSIILEIEYDKKVVFTRYWQDNLKD